MNRYFLLAVCLLSLPGASSFLQAQGPDDEYVRIYNLIQQADALAENGDGELARQKYSEAQTQLNQVLKAYPGWNEQVVQFRLGYVSDKLRSARNPDGPTRQQPAEKAAPASSETVNRIGLLSEQVRQLTAENELLQAKLKEAFSAQPAAVDPRELARSEEKIKSLRKEVEVLTVYLKKAETKPDKPIDPAAYQQTKQALAAANQKLKQQMELVASLTLEREALQRQFQKLAGGADTQAHREGNELLKGRTIEPRTSANDVKEPSSDVPAAPVRDGYSGPGQKVPEAPLNEAVSRPAIESPTQKRTLAKQLADARKAVQTNADLVSALRIALQRAQEEKEALAPEIRRPETVTGEASDFNRPLRSPDAESRLLVSEAESAFAAKHSAEAETNYAQAMRLDENNALMRGNLAAARLDHNQAAESEANLKRALSKDPKNAVGLSLLGIVKVRQRKFDEAFALLSQSAQLDPQNAETFQYLGVALLEKGMRMPAESAFRRAIQLAPENAEAHYQLALMYSTHQPPSLELARWHYQKGLASGHPKDVKLEQMLGASRPSAGGGMNALNR